MTDITESDIDSGWLRASVFGGMDGLTTSSALVIGLASNDLPLNSIVAAGFLAGIAGAISMAAGEYVSVETHSEQPDAYKFNPWTAAGSSFICFAVGSLIPLTPLILGYVNITVLCIVSALALFGAGALATRFTSRSWWFGGTRQLLLGGFATGVTYLLGTYLSQ